MVNKTVPSMIVNTLARLGVISLPPAATKVRVEEKRKSLPLSRQAKVVGGESYDPDKEFIEAVSASPKMFDFTSDTDPQGRVIAGYSAELFETNGRAWKLTKVTGDKSALLEAMKRASNKFTEAFGDALPPASQLRESSVDREEFLEALSTHVLDECLHQLREGYTFDNVLKTLREADDFAYGNGGSRGSFSDSYYGNRYGDGFDANQDYTPVMGGPWNKQLYLSAYLDMHSKAFEAYNHNPLAHQIIRLATMFTLGRGIDHTCSNEVVDELVREFVDRTEFYERLQNMSTDLWWAGELFVEYFDNTPSRGLTDFRAQDPSTILDIITQPDDYRNVYYAHQQYSTPYQNYISSGKNQPEAVKYIIRQIPANQYLHIKINSSEYEKRGRSELFSVLGWLKRLKDLMNARVIKGQLEAAFVWDIEIASGDADVEATGLQLPDPYNPGATFIHNKSLKLTPQSSSLRGSDASPDIMELKGLIATGTSTPKAFLGETSRGSTASALAGTEPGTKNYETKQQIQMRIVYAVLDRVIANAAKNGDINLDEVLKDARTVKRLAVVEDSIDDRDDVQEEFDKNKADAEQQQQQQLDAQNQAVAQQGATSAPMVGVNKNQQLGGAKQLALPGSTGASPSMVNVKSSVKETLVKTTSKNEKTLSDSQKRRIQAIKKSGRYAREIIELSFPSIAQEDRTAKLKDLALSEAMEWLPKSVVATMAAKELNITTYDFQETWAMIVQEAKDGMSIAHVYGQDNKHVPEVAIAQSIQEEDQAMSPAAAGGPTNVPVPPTVNGMKQTPPKAPGAVPPGQKPNSGDTKVNNKLAPAGAPNPTDPSDGHSAAAKSPFTNEGVANAKKKESAVLQRAIYTVMLREAIKPMIDMRTSLARYILTNESATKQFEEAVSETEKMRTNTREEEA